MARQQTSTKQRPRTGAGRAAKRAPSRAGSRRLLPWIGGGIAAVVVVLVVVVLLTGAGGASKGTTVKASNGSWTNITADMLASELKHKDFTLLNVKTPYIGEIQGTDLYIPYTDLASRASELPADKSAKIVVYCRSGAESAIASQTLLDLGYTNIQNLDGGMNAWTASGRSLVNLGRA